MGLEATAVGKVVAAAAAAMVRVVALVVVALPVAARAAMVAWRPGRDHVLAILFFYAGLVWSAITTGRNKAGIVVRAGVIESDGC